MYYLEMSKNIQVVYLKNEKWRKLRKVHKEKKNLTTNLENPPLFHTNYIVLKKNVI